jgi:hypothetical protein
MKTLSLVIDTSDLNPIRVQQSQVIKRAHSLSKRGFDFKAIHSTIPSTILDGHLDRSAIQRGIDLASTKQPKVIFGGRKNFIRRCKGLISNEEWKALRMMPLYSIGQANAKGNRRFRMDYPNRTLTYKDATQELQFQIPMLKPNWEIILEEICQKAADSKLALSFSVSDKEVHVTYDETQLECYRQKYQPYPTNKFRYLGIDLNPDRIGVSVYDTRQQDTIHSEQYELTSPDQAKRQNEISHICQSIAKLMKHYHVSRVGMEDLDIKSKNHMKGKRFNRQVNMWIRTFIKGKMRMICTLMGVQFCGLVAAYSSFVGTLRNPDLGDCCGAASELACRCGYKTTGFYPKLLSKAELVHRWKEMADSVAMNWVDLYEEFKTRHVGWRSPPRGSRSSRFGAWSERLLVHQMGVSKVIHYPNSIRYRSQRTRLGSHPVDTTKQLRPDQIQPRDFLSHNTACACAARGERYQ